MAFLTTKEDKMTIETLALATFIVGLVVLAIAVIERWFDL